MTKGLALALWIYATAVLVPALFAFTIYVLIAGVLTAIVHAITDRKRH